MPPASSNFLAATSVTVQNDAVVANDVTDAMLWTAESAPKYMYLKITAAISNGSRALRVNSMLQNVGRRIREWQYENNKDKLYTVSTAAGVGIEFVLLYKSGSPSYFQSKVQWNKHDYQTL